MIVLETFGKYQEVKSVRISLFLTKKAAEKYCDEATSNITTDGFWQHAEMIEDKVTYELQPRKYINYDNPTKKTTKN